MDCPFCPDGREYLDRPRGRLSLWAPLAIIALVLGTAALAAANVTDTRDVAARHGSVPMSRAL